MIVKVSEKIGQLKIEAYEKIVRLIMTASEGLQCFFNSVSIERSYQA